jgi:hypothetical protein
VKNLIGKKKIEKINTLFLSLSGFPFHINLKHLLSISFLYFSGKTHELTIKVKIGIIKALMISTLPNIERFRFHYDKNKVLILWNGKPDKVKRNTLIGDFEKGGLKMIDIESYFISLKASWVSRLADSKSIRFIF